MWVTLYWSAPAKVEQNPSSSTNRFDHKERTIPFSTIEDSGSSHNKQPFEYDSEGRNWNNNFWHCLNVKQTNVLVTNITNIIFYPAAKTTAPIKQNCSVNPWAQTITKSTNSKSLTNPPRGWVVRLMEGQMEGNWAQTVQTPTPVINKKVGRPIGIQTPELWKVIYLSCSAVSSILPPLLHAACCRLVSPQSVTFVQSAAGFKFHSVIWKYYAGSTGILETLDIACIPFHLHPVLSGLVCGNPGEKLQLEDGHLVVASQL